MTNAIDLRLSTAEKAYLIVAAAYLGWVVYDLLTEPRRAQRTAHDLTREDIERLQRGLPVSLGRWGGHEMLLEGDVIVNVGQDSDCGCGG